MPVLELATPEVGSRIQSPASDGRFIIPRRKLWTAVGDRPREPHYVPMVVAVSLEENHLENMGLSLQELTDHMRYGMGAEQYEPITSTGSLDTALCKAYRAKGQWGSKLIDNIRDTMKPTTEYLKLISN